MIERNMTKSDWCLALHAAGFEPEMVESYLSDWAMGNRDKQLQLLSLQRKKLLEHIHQEEKQIDCLDYLTYQLQKNTD